MGNYWGKCCVLQVACNKAELLERLKGCGVGYRQQVCRVCGEVEEHIRISLTCTLSVN
jgi:hypothetical protein